MALGFLFVFGIFTLNIKSNQFRTIKINLYFLLIYVMTSLVLNIFQLKSIATVTGLIMVITKIANKVHRPKHKFAQILLNQILLFLVTLTILITTWINNKNIYHMDLFTHVNNINFQSIYDVKQYPPYYALLTSNASIFFDNQFLMSYLGPLIGIILFYNVLIYLSHYYEFNLIESLIFIAIIMMPFIKLGVKSIFLLWPTQLTLFIFIIMALYFISKEYSTNKDNNKNLLLLAIIIIMFTPQYGVMVSFIILCILHREKVKLWIKAGFVLLIVNLFSNFFWTSFVWSRDKNKNEVEAIYSFNPPSTNETGSIPSLVILPNYPEIDGTRQNSLIDIVIDILSPKTNNIIVKLCLSIVIIMLIMISRKIIKNNDYINSDNLQLFSISIIPFIIFGVGAVSEYENRNIYFLWGYFLVILVVLIKMLTLNKIVRNNISKIVVIILMIITIVWQNIYYPLIWNAQLNSKLIKSIGESDRSKIIYSEYSQYFKTIFPDLEIKDLSEFKYQHNSIAYIESVNYTAQPSNSAYWLSLSEKDFDTIVAEEEIDRKKRIISLVQSKPLFCKSSNFGNIIEIVC
jgi:hypothetical protein